MGRRYVFGEDTLLKTDMEEQKKFFADKFETEADRRLCEMYDMLRKYDMEHSQHDNEEISKLIAKTINYNFTPTDISGWDGLVNGARDNIEPEFKGFFEKKLEEFIEEYYYFLIEYGRKYGKFSYDTLSEFLSKETSLGAALHFTTEDIIELDELYKSWGEAVDGAEETLDYLKSEGNSLGIYVNWFRNTLIERLRKAKLLKFFDNWKKDILTGEEIAKPAKNGYDKIARGHKGPNCIFVGTSIENDYIDAKGYQPELSYEIKDGKWTPFDPDPKSTYERQYATVLFDPKDNVDANHFVKIKTLGELKDYDRRHR